MALNQTSRRVWLTVERVEDLSAGMLIDAGVEGVLVDMDGTLIPHHVYAFSDGIRALLSDWQAAGLRVAIYSNAAEQSGFDALGVPVVTGGALKPARRGFEHAMRHGLGLSDPSRVVMVGDNPVTDGAAVDAGLRFVHCRPLAGRERWGHRFGRSLGALMATRRGGD